MKNSSCPAGGAHAQHPRGRSEVLRKNAVRWPDVNSLTSTNDRFLAAEGDLNFAFENE